MALNRVWEQSVLDSRSNNSQDPQFSSLGRRETYVGSTHWESATLVHDIDNGCLDSVQIEWRLLTCIVSYLGALGFRLLNKKVKVASLRKAKNSELGHKISNVLTNDIYDAENFVSLLFLEIPCFSYGLSRLK